MRIKRGSVLIALGLLLLASAGGLTAYNLYDEYSAGKQAQQALELFSDLLPCETRMDAGDEPLSMPAARQEFEQAALQPIQTVSPSGETSSVQNVQQSIQPVVLPTEQPDGQAEPVLSTPMPSGGDAAFVLQSTESPVIHASQTTTTEVPALSFPSVTYAEATLPSYVLNPQIKMPVKEKDGQAYIGVLEIPSLDLMLPVISEWNYARLKKAPCRYAGSAYTDDLVIAAHNYKTHFGNLKRLNEGDSVTFTDAEGNRFEYKVVLTETLMPRDVDEMKSGEFDLSLFTCTVGGSYRVTVRCDKLKESGW